MSTGERPPSRPENSAAPRVLQLGDVLSFVARNAVLIVGSAVLSAGLYAGFALLTASPVFKTSATLVMTRSAAPSPFRPEPLSTAAYKQLLDSDAIAAETRRRLIAKNAWPRKVPLRSGRELRSRIFGGADRRTPPAAAPMIELITQAPTPEAAAAAANTWAEVFLQAIGRLMASTTRESIAVFEDEYPGSRERLAELEQERDDLIGEFEARLRQTEDHWSERLAEYQRGTLELESAYKSETARLVTGLESQVQSATRKAEMEVTQDVFGEMSRRLATLDVSLANATAQAAAVQERLTGTDRVLTLRKALSDDALWEAVDRSEREGQPVNWEALRDRVLASEEINPLYRELERNLSQSILEADTLPLQQKRIAEELERLRRELDRLDAEMLGAGLELQTVRYQREAGLIQLRLEREAGLARLERQKEGEIAATLRQKETAVASLGREISSEVNRFTELSKSYPQVTLARAQLGVQDVRLGASAVAPDRPQPRPLNFKLLVAFLGGALAGFFLALVRETRRTGLADAA